ncbi:MAG: NUDIX domain-containing protein [Roseburia sp.]|nr:NUDIX domain-containing protein [Roseburia sp.]
MATTVNFYDDADDSLLKFAVIIAEANGKSVFCKHRLRDTYEVPGGHREPNESIEETARRELYEETGALDFTIVPVCVYSVVRDGNTASPSYGKLFYAQISAFEPDLHSEIEKITLTDKMPTALTYPDIQPFLIDEARRRGFFVSCR